MKDNEQDKKRQSSEASALAQKLKRAAHRRVRIEERVVAGKHVLRVQVEGDEK